jgi:hypothetical protein
MSGLLTTLKCTFSYMKEGLFGTGTNSLGGPIPSPLECSPTYAFIRSYLRDFIVIGVTLGTFAVFTYFYLKVLQPTIVYEVKGGPAGDCPDLWIYEHGECKPTYETTCKPFDPVMQKGKECDIARACGTSWKGLCK